MSTDLEQRIAELASAWEHEAPTISVDEVRDRRRSVSREPADRLGVPDHLPDLAVEAVVVPFDEVRRRHRRTVAVAAAAVVVIVGVVALAQRSPDDVEPSSPVTTLPEPDDADPGLEVPSPTQPTPTRPTPTQPTPPQATTDTTAADASVVDASVVDVSAPEPSTRPASEPAWLPADEVAAKLAEIEAEQREALRGVTTIGFVVTQTETLPAGLPPEAYATPTPVRAVVRNDGSTAVVGADGGFSYYDAATGTARTGFTGPDGTAVTQVWSGQSSAHMAFGLPTGLSASVAQPAGWLAPGVVAIEQDLVGGRPTWRIDQVQIAPAMLGGVETESRTSTWIDRANGIVVRTRDTGWATDPDGVAFAVTSEVTVGAIEFGVPMPAGFEDPVPPDAAVERFGDPFAYGPITYEQAAAELGPGVVVPTIDADQVVVERIVFGEGIENVGVTLVARWFDGFAVTEFRAMRFPEIMGPIPDSCADCEGSLLDQLRAADIGSAGVTVGADGYSVGITGDPDQVRAIVDSLVTVP